MPLKNITSIIVLSAILISVYNLSQDSHQSTLVSEYEQWKQDFNIKYDSAFENLYRQKLFINKKILISAHNSNPSISYTRGINQFSALTQQEFRQIYLTYQRDYAPQVKVLNKDKNDQQNTPIPNINIDWRTQGAVGPIKDQGKCGSCWAFSTVAGLQATSKVFHGELKSFSQQQLVDCDLNNRGCVGGQMRLAIDYVKKHGSSLESEYPYKGVRGLCLKPNGHFFVSGHSDVSGCSNLVNALSSRPFVVGLDANTWDDYQSGVFDNCVNDKGVFNHGVLLIGVTSDYWLIKNSFGTKWGENGFMRLKYGDTCNICEDGILIEK